MNEEISEHRIIKLWCKGEKCILETTGELYRVFKVYTDFQGKDHVMIQKVKGEETLDLINDRNLKKVTNSDKKATQLSLPLTVFLTLLR